MKDRHLIFLSHIHEEKDLAIIIKEFIENEFSGFVDVFVSSDGKSITAGANFLKRIEDALVNCCAALYLISPNSVKRNWINCELGAVWIRNVMSVRSGGSEILAIPVCHSGITPSNLPQPLNNLNAIQGNNALQLKFAFCSIQTAVGGRGALKSNFEELSVKVIELERKYTLGANIRCLLSVFSTGNIPKILAQCKTVPPDTDIELKIPHLQIHQVHLVRGLEAKELKGLIKVNVPKSSISFGSSGPVNVADVNITINTKSDFTV